LKPGFVWIRGVDSEPVLTTVKKVGLDWVSNRLWIK
jgi:hypothetical protein